MKLGKLEGGVRANMTNLCKAASLCAGRQRGKLVLILSDVYERCSTVRLKNMVMAAVSSRNRIDCATFRGILYEYRSFKSWIVLLFLKLKKMMLVF